MALEARRRMRIAAVIVVALCAAALAACGSSATSTTRRPAAAATRTVTRTATPTTAASATPSTTMTTTAPSATSSTSSAAPAGPGPCRAAGLALSFLGGQGATGHGELAFALRNTSSASCRTGGYPGVLFLDRSGKGLPTTPTHTTSDFFGHTALRTLTVAPGATVSFRLGVSHVGTGGSSDQCTSAAALQVIAPDDTATLHVGVHGGIAECGGTVTVSPLQPGRSAFR